MKKLIFFLLLPLLIFSEELNTNQISDEQSQIDKQIEIQTKTIENIIVNLNDEKYLSDSLEIKNINKEIDFLNKRLNANKKLNNDLAVIRDEIRIDLLKDKLNFENTLKQIVIAKKEFKDKKFFINLIQKNIDLINNYNFLEYENVYNNLKNSNNKISNEIVSNYLELNHQTTLNLYVLKYLQDNMQKFRASNFFIDEFNLQYLIKKIDSIKAISFVSNLTSYYFNFSIGDISVVIFILIFFKLVNKYIISLIVNFISKIFVKDLEDNSDEIRRYLNKSINRPLSYTLYTLAIHISILILVKDTQTILKIIPWINSFYMALITWAIYAILNNSITIYAQNILEKYPNVRKEMIVFILRIIKIILILIVVLFLLSQLEFDIKAIAASLGVGGIAIALASKDTLANFFGSLNIMTDNSFSQGDWIKTKDVEGTVVDIRMRTTRIRTFDNAMITIPNSQLANDHIMNWSKRVIGRRIKMSIGITYESKMQDIKNLKNDIHEMLKNHPDIASDENINITKSKTFEAIKKEDLQGIKNTLLVYIDEFGPSSINILVYCFSKTTVWADWLETKEDVIMKIAALVEKNNCDFAYPTQAILLKNPTQIATMEN